jgi:hypothetical protein
VQCPRQDLNHNHQQQQQYNNKNNNTYLATPVNKLIEESQIPDWLTTGIIILIPKNENTERPMNYRPTLCFVDHASKYISIVGPTRCTFCIQFIVN